MRFKTTHVIMLLLALGLAGTALVRLCQRPPASANTPLAVDGLPVLGQIAPFTLIERSGKPAGLEQLQGQIWVADFVFTSCAGPCPMMTTAMSKLQTAVARYNDIKLVSITVDPTRDTPEVLRPYAEKYGADPIRWWFLTGPVEDIHRLAVQSFKLGSVEDPVMHSTYFVLVDRIGKIRGYYDSVEPDIIARLTRDIERLHREKAP